MKSSPRITYSPRPDTTPEAERTALASVYKHVLAKKKAAPESRPDDAKGSVNDRALKEYTG